MRKIDADELLEKMKCDSLALKVFFKGADMVIDVTIGAIEDSIKECKTIEPVKQEKWLHEICSGEPIWDICPLCGMTEPHSKDHHYCSKCGAKMEEPNEDQQEDD